MNVPIVRFVLLWFVVLLPAAARAQSSGAGAIAGVVRDTSGAVIPGVIVEAASPALIDRVRSVVSDERGLYRIVDLRPGSYSVTFTLPGFSTFKREGVELTTSFTATINAEMSAGSLAETVTVLEEAPVVDIQNVRQQTTIARETLDAIPTTKRLGQYASIIPGATYTNPTFQDVGGNQGEGGQFGVHGQRGADLSTNVEGLNQNQQALGVFSFNSQAFQEIVVETSGMSAEAMTGGVQLNIISKDGGNRLSGSLSMAYTGPSLQMGNLTDALRARGLNTDISIRKSYDYGGALGGPIKKDKLWFFTAHRWWGASRYIQGSYFNKAQGTLFYEPDLGRVSHNNEYFEDHSLRLTWQAAPKHKIVASFSHQNNCSRPWGRMTSGSRISRLTSCTAPMPTIISGPAATCGGLLPSTTAASPRPTTRAHMPSRPDSACSGITLGAPGDTPTSTRSTRPGPTPFETGSPIPSRSGRRHSNSWRTRRTSDCSRRTSGPSANSRSTWACGTTA